MRASSRANAPSVLGSAVVTELDAVSAQPVSYPNWIQEGFKPARVPAANLG